MSDELAKAITKVIYPVLKADGFGRARKRDLIRVENGIVHGLYFQVSAWGGRSFCVTAYANIVAANHFIALSPGFRLTRDTDGGDLWLPSLTTDEALRSAEVILGSIKIEVLPYFDRCRTPQTFAELLAHEDWASHHHLNFQRGVAEAMSGEIDLGIQHLRKAIVLYNIDAQPWCADYIGRAESLVAALQLGSASLLIEDWFRANRKAHGIKA